MTPEQKAQWDEALARPSHGNGFPYCRCNLCLEVALMNRVWDIADWLSDSIHKHERAVGKIPPQLADLRDAFDLFVRTTE